MFYTTIQGHFKGLIPWSMTEPIQITKTDEHHFQISVHTSSRIYHFNDPTQGAAKWVEIITEVPPLSLCLSLFTHLLTFSNSSVHAGKHI
jgi:hypothetical protein